MRPALALPLLVGCACATPWRQPAHVERSVFDMSSNNTQQVFFGRFISTPAQDVLSIETGAVLVNSSDGRGVIENAVWNVTDIGSALQQLGAGSNATVIYAADDGFFFPGFIGE